MTQKASTAAVGGDGSSQPQLSSSSEALPSSVGEEEYACTASQEEGAGEGAEGLPHTAEASATTTVNTGTIATNDMHVSDDRKHTCKYRRF